MIPSANMPMTRLEETLHKCMVQRPDILERILSPEELLEYVIWMAENHSSSYDVDLSDVPVLPTQLNTASILGKMPASALTDRTAELLTAMYSTQNEDQYILADHDISAGRMLRYMPAHWHTNTYFEIYYAFSGNCPVHPPGL